MRLIYPMAPRGSSNSTFQCASTFTKFRRVPNLGNLYVMGKEVIGGQMNSHAVTWDGMQASTEQTTSLDQMSGN